MAGVGEKAVVFQGSPYVPALVNGNGTPSTPSTTGTEVRDIPLPTRSIVDTCINNLPPLSTATLTTNTTDVATGTTPLPASNTTDATNNGTAPSPAPDTTGVTDRVTPPPASALTDVTIGSTPIPASNSTDVVSGATPTSASESILLSVATPSVSSVDVITIDLSPLKIKTEVMDEEFNTNTAGGKNLMENIDWFLDQVKDGYRECDAHKMDMLEQNLVCLSCQKFMCALCLRDFHCGHDIISISKLRECRNVRNTLEDDVSALQLMQQAFKTEFDDKQELKKQVEKSAETLLKNVDTAFDQLLKIVENKRDEIKKHICDFEKQNVGELCKDLERIKAIEQSATLMIRRVMVFFTRFDIVEARVLPESLLEVLSKCKEFRVDRRVNEHKEKFLPEKKFSNILPSLLAVTNICKTIHPEATKVVWSKITPDRRNGADISARPVSEDTKDPSIFLAHLASLPDDTRSPSPFDTDTTEEMEVTIPKPRKNTPGPKRNSDERVGMVCSDPTGRGKANQKAEKRKEKDRSVSPATVRSSPKSSKKARISTEPSSTSPPPTSSSSSPSFFSDAIISPSVTTTASSHMSSLPVITSVVSLAESSKSTGKKMVNSNEAVSGLFDIDFNSVSTTHEPTKHSKDHKKVMAVVPSVNNALNKIVKPPGRRPVLQQARHSGSSSSSLESLSTATVSPAVTSAPTSRTMTATSASRTTAATSASPSVAATSSSRATNTMTSTFAETSPRTYSRLTPSARSRSPVASLSRGSADRETGMATGTAASGDREQSEGSDEAPTVGEDNLPILSLLSFYPQTMTHGRIVLVRALQGKIWLGYVSNISQLKTNSYFSVQWLTGQYGVDTKFEIQDKWLRKSDKVHTDCVICHFNYTLKQEMPEELIRQLKIGSKQPPCSMKPRSEPPTPSTASPSNVPTRSDNRTQSASPRSGRDNSTGTAAMTTRRGTPNNKSSNKSNTKS